MSGLSRGAGAEKRRNSVVPPNPPPGKRVRAASFDGSSRESVDIDEYDEGADDDPACFSYRQLKLEEHTLGHELGQKMAPPAEGMKPATPNRPRDKHSAQQLLANAKLDHHITPEEITAGKQILEILELRRKYVFKAKDTPSGAPLKSPIAQVDKPRIKTTHHLIQKTPKDKNPNHKPKEVDPFKNMTIPGASDHLMQMRDGVFHVYQTAEDLLANKDMIEFHDYKEFCEDADRLHSFMAAGPPKTFCYRRLRLLEAKFNLHVLLNDQLELREQKSVPHRDFYNVRKVDTHVHLASSMNQKHLLRFIKKKVRMEPDEEVCVRDSHALSLATVFKSLNLTPYDISVDTLDMHADKSTFQRFDRFNLKYNPMGQSRLREIFLKTDNHIHGRYLAEIANEVFDDLESSKYQLSEPRVSIYGRKREEWDNVATWVTTHKVHSPWMRWMVQIPRLYSIHKKSGYINTFLDMLENIFVPLFEATRDPSSHPELHKFLSMLVGFDCVDDESKLESKGDRIPPSPQDWDGPDNPPYQYYMYYLYANLTVLNKFREAKGMNTFSLRPHAGEAGDVEHLATTFLLAEGIAHGLNLRRSPVLQYLYYLAQIGIYMSPLSNNFLFLDYHKNPCPLFFARGLSVSLSTDDPLQFHFTKEALMEEYSIAAQVWKLSNTDLCELARNSVLHSGFTHMEKSHWLGDKYWEAGANGNDIEQTNVPNTRLKFRADNLNDEMEYIRQCAAEAVPVPPTSPAWLPPKGPGTTTQLTSAPLGQPAVNKK